MGMTAKAGVNAGFQYLLVTARLQLLDRGSSHFCTPAASDAQLSQEKLAAWVAVAAAAAKGQQHRRQHQHSRYLEKVKD